MDIKRENALVKIRRYYDSNLIKVLTGVRRCGKSVLLSQIKEELKTSKSIPEDHIISISFEDLAYSKLNTSIKLNDYILKQIKDKEKYYLFLDEIQHVREFEKALSSLKATQNVSIFVTGSNSKLLSGHLATLLVGRCKEFRIGPFTYPEYLEYYKENNLPLPAKPFQDYLRYGGMPQRFDYTIEEDIREYLSSIYHGIMDKDICNNKSKINKEAFITIADYILSNSAKEFSADSIIDYYNKNNKDKVYRSNIYLYLEKLEQACLIHRVKRYDIATKRNLKSVEKQFAVDTGFLFCCTQSNQIVASHALENLVYNELISRGYDVRIGKTYKGEIDFVAMKESKKCFIQVAYYLLDQTTIDREFNAYSSVRDSSPKYVMSLDEMDLSRDGITHLNIEDWLLGKTDLFLS